MAELAQNIKVNEIESALFHLWEKHQSTNTIRASLFNLVIYVKQASREDYLQDLAKTIIRKYPCRMIVITEKEKEGKGYLNTSVTDIQPEEGSSIFCDLINFEVAGSYRERIPFVVLPHLLPEKPVYLLWGGDPLESDPISLKLENRATRTIFDSECAKDMTKFAAMMLDHQESVTCDIADLNWARFYPWRDLFATAFNEAEALRCIREAKEIHITYNVKDGHTSSHPKIQAAYFQGWIAARLGWEFDTVLGTREELCFRYKKNGNSVHLVLNPGHLPGLSVGRIISTEIISYHGDRIHFERDHNNVNRIAMHHCACSTCNLPTYHLFSKEMTGRSMMHEIYNQGTDPSFLKVLKLLKQCKQGILA